LNSVTGWISGAAIDFGMIRQGIIEMADVTISDDPPRIGLITVNRLRLAQRLLVAAFLAVGSWAAVNEATVENRCETTLGRAAVRFKLDSYYSNCQCMTRSLDFSDACNSGYVPLL
jgi:hypothetical protein